MLCRLAPRFVPAHELFQDTGLALGRQAELLAFYRAQARSRDPVALVLLARIVRGEERLALLKEALARAPGLAYGHYALAYELARTLDLEPALRHLEEALRLDPDFPRAYRLLARVQRKLLREADEEAALVAYLKRCPRDAAAWFRLGCVRHHQGNLAGAEAAYRTVLRLPRDAFLRALRERALALTEEELQRLEGRVPLDVQARLNLGGLYLERAEREAVFSVPLLSAVPLLGRLFAWSRPGVRRHWLLEAERVLVEAAARAPRWPEPHYNLGILYEKLGRTALARRHLERYLALGGEHRERVAAWLAQLPEPPPGRAAPPSPARELDDLRRSVSPGRR